MTVPLHSPLAPSAAHRWAGGCPGSVRRCLGAVSAESQAAREGSAAHWVAAGGIGNTAPNGIEVTDDMREGADLWRAYVGSDAVIETGIQCSSIHSECYGTPDAWKFDGTVRVWDYKFGHRQVEAFENLQLISYASGIGDLIGLNGETDQTTPFALTIIQPHGYHRMGPIRTWHGTMADLRGYLNQLRAAADDAMSDDPTTKTGNYCLYCDAAASCSALMAASATWCDESTRSLSVDLPPEALGRELQIVQRARADLSAREDALVEMALAIIRSGGNVPGYIAQQGTGRERWLDNATGEIAALADLLGIVIAKPQQFITPKQAIKAGFDAETVQKFTETPKGELKLVPVTNAKHIFQGT